MCSSVCEAAALLYLKGITFLHNTESTEMIHELSKLSNLYTHIMTKKFLLYLHFAEMPIMISP